LAQSGATWRNLEGLAGGFAGLWRWITWGRSTMSDDARYSTSGRRVGFPSQWASDTRDGFVPLAPVVEPELGSVAHSRCDSEISTEPRPGVYPGAAKLAISLAGASAR